MFGYVSGFTRGLLASLALKETLAQAVLKGFIECLILDRTRDVIGVGVLILTLEIANHLSADILDECDVCFGIEVLPRRKLSEAITHAGFMLRPPFGVVLVLGTASEGKEDPEERH